MLGFYDIDTQYADYLRAYDNRVPHFDYASNQKFLCGIVLTIGGLTYYAPVSHNPKAYPTSFVIKHPKNGNHVLGTIRFNYMFPADTSVVAKKNFSVIKGQNLGYYNLLINELQYCQAHEQEVLKLASKVYKWGTNPSNYYFQHCCDFRLLESVCTHYHKT